MKPENSNLIALPGSTEFRKKRKKSWFKLLALSLCIVVLVLCIVIVVRHIKGKPLLPSGESYYNLRMAQALKENSFIIEDPLQNTPYQPNPYHYLLFFLLLAFSPEVVSVITPVLLGLISAIIFFRLLTLLGVKHKDAAYSLIILSVSPAFINLFTGLYLYGFVIFLTLLIVFLVIISKKSKFTLALSSLLLLILALTSLTAFVITIGFLLIICTALNRKINAVMLPVFPSVATLIVLAFLSIYKPILLGFHRFEFRNILSVLGAGLGYDLFLILLFFAGFMLLWFRSGEKKLLQWAVLGFFVFSFFNIIARAYSSMVITFYCVTAIKYFYNRKWELEIIRTGTLLLVLSSLVFSATSQINLLVNAQPDKYMEEALLFLEKLGPGKVLSSEENGFIVEFYSKKEALLDKNSFLTPRYDELMISANGLFLTPRLSEAEPLLQKYGIRYVLITPDMKESIWEGQEEGLWFLVQNSISFVRKYEYQSIEIWEYAPGRIR